jgi:hypothetical protein
MAVMETKNYKQMIMHTHIQKSGLPVCLGIPHDRSFCSPHSSTALGWMPCRMAVLVPCIACGQ